MRLEDFEQLYAEHAQPLFGFLAYRTGDRVLAEDLLADTFERALRARSRYDPRKAQAKTWLYTIALNCLRDSARKADAESRAVDQLGGAALATPPESQLDRVEGRDVVARAMVGLSDEERETVALRYGGDLTAPEIAKLLGEKLTTVEGRLYRALRKLRADLDSADDE